MIREEEIDYIKKYLGPDGKLIISDELDDKQKERFQFINSLDIDLVGVLSNRRDDNIDESIEDEEPEEFNESDEDDDVEVLEYDDGPSESTIEENGEAVTDLDDFF